MEPVRKKKSGVGGSSSGKSVVKISSKTIVSQRFIPILRDALNEAAPPQQQPPAPIPLICPECPKSYDLVQLCLVPPYPTTDNRLQTICANCGKVFCADRADVNENAQGLSNLAARDKSGAHADNNNAPATGVASSGIPNIPVIGKNQEQLARHASSRQDARSAASAAVPQQQLPNSGGLCPTLQVCKNIPLTASRILKLTESVLGEENNCCPSECRECGGSQATREKNKQLCGQKALPKIRRCGQQPSTDPCKCKPPCKCTCDCCESPRTKPPQKRLPPFLSNSCKKSQEKFGRECKCVRKREKACGSGPIMEVRGTSICCSRPPTCGQLEFSNVSRQRQPYAGATSAQGNCGPFDPRQGPAPGYYYGPERLPGGNMDCGNIQSDGAFDDPYYKRDGNFSQKGFNNNNNYMQNGPGQGLSNHALHDAFNMVGHSQYIGQDLEGQSVHNFQTQNLGQRSYVGQDVDGQPVRYFPNQHIDPCQVRDQGGRYVYNGPGGGPPRYAPGGPQMTPSQSQLYSDPGSTGVSRGPFGPSDSGTEVGITDSFHDSRGPVTRGRAHNDGRYRPPSSQQQPRKNFPRGHPKSQGKKHQLGNQMPYNPYGNDRMQPENIIQSRKSPAGGLVGQPQYGPQQTRGQTMDNYSSTPNTVGTQAEASAGTQTLSDETTFAQDFVDEGLQHGRSPRLAHSGNQTKKSVPGMRNHPMRAKHHHRPTAHQLENQCLGQQPLQQGQQQISSMGPQLISAIQQPCCCKQLLWAVEERC